MILVIGRPLHGLIIFQSNQVIKKTHAIKNGKKITFQPLTVLLTWIVYGVFAQRARGAMDNASAYGAEDSRFESWRARYIYFSYKKFDPSARNQSHVGRVRFPLRAEMHGRGHITDSCFIAFVTSKIR